MSNVEFNEERPQGIQSGRQAKSKLAGWLIKKGLAKDESGAQKIMIAIIIICFAVAVYYAFFN